MGSAVSSVVDTVGSALGDVASTAGDIISNPIVDSAAAIATGQPELLGLDAAGADAATAAAADTFGSSTAADIAANEAASAAADTFGSSTAADITANEAASAAAAPAAADTFGSSTAADITANEAASAAAASAATIPPTIPPGTSSILNSLLNSSSNLLNSSSNLGGALYDALGNLITSGVGPGALLAALAYKCQQDLNKQAMAPYNANIQQTADYNKLYQSGVGLPALNVTYQGSPIKAAPGATTALGPIRNAQNVVVKPQVKEGGLIDFKKKYKKGGDVKNPIGIEHVMIKMEKENPNKKQLIRKIKSSILSAKMNPVIKKAQLIRKMNPNQYMQLVNKGKQLVRQQIQEKRIKQADGTSMQGLQNMLTPTTMPSNLSNYINAKNQLNNNRQATNQQLLLARLEQIKNATRPSGIALLNKKEGGSIPEIDYRDKGGFVPPIGKKERADDIPAMLSNNEFVFTANAVRNAGQGDVKEGAKKMYKLMKHLEGKK